MISLAIIVGAMAINTYPSAKNILTNYTRNREMSRNKILLVYPKLGMAGSLVQHMPLSSLCAIDSIKAGLK